MNLIWGKKVQEKKRNTVFFNFFFYFLFDVFSFTFSPDFIKQLWIIKLSLSWSWHHFQYRNKRWFNWGIGSHRPGIRTSLHSCSMRWEKGWFWPGCRIHFSYNCSLGKVYCLWHGERVFCLVLDALVLFKSLLEASLKWTSFSVPLYDWPAKPQMRLNIAGRQHGAAKRSRSFQQFSIRLSKRDPTKSFKVQDTHGATVQTESLSKSGLTNVFIITSPPITPQMWLLMQ